MSTTVSNATRAFFRAIAARDSLDVEEIADQARR